LLILIFPVFLYSQYSKKSNLEIFEQTISSKLEEVILSPNLNRDALCIFKFSDYLKNQTDSDELRFTKNLIKKLCSANKIRFSYLQDTAGSDYSPQDSVYSIILIEAKEFKTEYTGFVKNKFLGEKTIERLLKGLLYTDVQKSHVQVYKKNVITINYKDEIPFDEYRSYENDDYRFTKGKPPEINFFERIIFPALLITASAGAILAFFIIRTK
jgi:hypothetical protein